MNVLYEEDGELKVASVLSQAPASFQIETPHGRRAKVKAGNVVLTYDAPGAAQLLAEARTYADALDTEFLWQCCGSAEFDFRELARDYVGRDATPVEAAGVLLKLHAAPMYFHRRARGRYQAAPEETLRLALASIEKKRRVQEAIGRWSEQLVAGECPAEIAALRKELLYTPDRNRPETKAIEQACRDTGLSTVQLFMRCGLVKDTHAYHLERFVHEFYPNGVGFVTHTVPEPVPDLPLSQARVFSLDDIGTTEIDDAFSVTPLADGTLRVGIHIAAPGLGFAPGSPLDAIARERLSTAYMPGCKFTMLPEDVVERFSLDHGSEQPAVSLYLDVSPADCSVRANFTRLERVAIAANLRHSRYDALNDAFVAGNALGMEFEDELRLLWRLANRLEAQRGKPSVNTANLDYVFQVEGERVVIVPRKRGAPLDKLVAELMILANNTWGEWLAERDIAGIYRVQSSGKVRMSVHAEPHEGLGVSCYAWHTSPLRRYVDLVNQWQLIASLNGSRPPFARNSDALLAALRAFEVTHARFDEHQRNMETYWCVRWLHQESVSECDATVVREGVVRLSGLPLTARVPGLPPLEAGARVRVRIAGVDLIAPAVACEFVAALAPEPEIARVP